MSNEKIESEPFRSQLLIEEYKWVQKRLETHENRYYQILVFCFTSIGLTLGYSGKIENIIIPLITSSIILISIRSAVGNRELQIFSSAYLLNKFHLKNVEVSFEKTYFDLFRNSEQSHKKLNFIWSLLNHAFAIIEFLNILIIIYFGREFVCLNLNNKPVLIFGILIILLVINSLILLNLLLSYKRGWHYWNKKVREYIEQKSPRSS